MKQRLPILTAALLLCIASVGRAEPADTPEQIKQLYTDGKYKDVLTQINKALAVKGPDAVQYDKHELLLLKGEASLRMKTKSAASDAFKQAAAAATEPNDIAVASATVELIRQSSATLKYQPKAKPAAGTSKAEKVEAIDIVEPDSRKQAFIAMEAELMAVAKPKVDAALKAKTLAEVAQAAKDPTLAALSPVEIAATGSDTESKQMLSDLGHHAYAMMDGPLDKMIERIQTDVDAINNRNKPVKAGQSSNNAATSKSGFLSEINNLSKSASEIKTYAVAMAPLFGDTTDFKPVQLKVSQIETAVKDLNKQVNGW